MSILLLLTGSSNTPIAGTVPILEATGSIGTGN
jgi:hypothetical protein